MRVRSWPSRPLKLSNAAVVSWCLLAAALLLPSRQEGAPINGWAEHSGQEKTQPANKRPSGMEQARTVEAYGSLPLAFEAHQGQTAGRVSFLSHGGGYSLFLTSNEAVLALTSGQTRKPGREAGGSPHSAAESRNITAPTLLRMRLLGSNTAAGMVGLDELPGKSNYLIGNNPANWRLNVSNYRRVAERGVYPGIDLIYYGTQRQLEYDFVVAPGVDPGAIRLAFQGANHLRIDSQGNLIARLPGGEVAWRRPIAYQETPQGLRQAVAVRYLKRGKREVAFRVGPHDPDRELIIDPVLAYSTYLGGSSIDGANAIAVAPDGSAFIAGGTFSSDFPTAHPLQPDAGGPRDFPQDAFVAKISPDGSTLLYSTYLGGKNTDIAYGIAVNSMGEAYVAGTTDSPDFPVTPSVFNTLCGGDGECGASWNPQGFIVYNGFVTKLNVEGSGLIYSGFLGEYENVECLAIAVDGAGNAYVTGEVGPNLTPTVVLPPTEPPPPPFPILGGFQATYGGSGTDALLAKIDASGSEILYSTYLGGGDEDVAYGIAVDGSANAYVAGETYSVDFPTAAALQSTYAGAGDAFLAKVGTNKTGAASLLYSTYLGGSGLDQANGVAVDASGNAYLAGVTTSKASGLGFSIPAGAFQPGCKLDSLSVCESDAFVAKFSLRSAPSLVYFTYLGGSLADSANGIAVDANQNAYVTGSTVSTDFPVSGAVFQTTYGGGNADAFVAELNSAGSELVYSTYLGGTNTESANGIALDLGNPASAYVAGQTCSLDFPIANPLQAAPGGNCDAFVSKVSFLEGIALNPSGLLFPTQSPGTTSPPQTVTLTNGDNAQTISSIGVTGPDSGDFSETTTCPVSTSTLAAAAQCTITLTFTPTAAGIRKASVTIQDSAPGSPHIISLTGSTSAVGLSASRLAFGNQQVGVASSPQALTVTNNGTTALTVSNVNVSGAYSQTNDCTVVPLQPTTNCVVNVTFTPAAPGPSVGAMTLIDNAPGNPQVVLLSGAGVAAPAVSLSAATLTFLGQVVGTTSTPQSVTLTNSGGSPLNIANVSSSGDFAQTNTCGASVASGNSCTIGVAFTPTASGNRYGSITITDNAADSPQAILLAGNGSAAPAVAFLPPGLTFANQSVSTTSAPQNVVLTNSGGAAMIINNIASSGDFAETNSCGTSLASGASCTIAVTFTPTAVGPRGGAVTVTDNAPGSPQTLPLSGSGVLAPVVALTPTDLTFSGQSVGTTSAAQTVTLTNIGKAVLEIANAATGGDFAQSNNCPASLAAGASCIFSISFTPTAPGNRYGSVTITDNAADSPQSIVLTGNGLPAPVVSLSATSLTFSSQPLGTTSAAQTVTLTDTGTAALTITGIVATGDFAQLDTCGASLAAGASCAISVTFTPTAAGSRAGSIIITDNATGSPAKVSLAGNGADFTVSVSPNSATVIAGNSVAYTFSVAPSFGFNAKVALSCSGAPRGATCLVSPSTLTPDGTNPIKATVTVTTAVRSMLPPRSGRKPLLPHLATRARLTWFLWLMLLFTFGASQAIAGRRWVLLRLALVISLGLLCAACGAGGSLVDTPNGTPAGNYTLTLTGSSGNQADSHSTTAGLTVQ